MVKGWEEVVKVVEKKETDDIQIYHFGELYSTFVRPSDDSDYDSDYDSGNSYGWLY